MFVGGTNPLADLVLGRPNPQGSRIRCYTGRSGGCNLQNAERDYNLLSQRKYIYARINPNPNSIANYKPYPNPKISQRERMESF